MTFSPLKATTRLMRAPVKMSLTHSRVFLCIHGASWKRSSLRTRVGSSGLVPTVQAGLCEALQHFTWFSYNVHPMLSKISHIRPSICARCLFSFPLRGLTSISWPSTPLSQQTWEPQLPPQQRWLDVSACLSTGFWTLTASLSTPISGGQEPARLAAQRSPHVHRGGISREGR